MEVNNLNQQQPPQTKTQSGFGITGMILGIIAILLSCIVIGGLLGIVGLIFSIVGISQKNRKKGLSIAGIVLNAIAIFIMIIMLTIAVSSDGDTVENVTSDSKLETTESEQISETSQSEEIFHIGDTAEYRNVQVTLTDVKESYGSQYNTPSDGNIFVLTEFEIVNNSDEELAISSMLSFTAYQDGYATNLSLSALMENNGEQLDGSIAPGKRMKGSVGYEIPSTCTELEVRVQPNVWSGKDMVFVYER